MENSSTTPSSVELLAAMEATGDLRALEAIINSTMADDPRGKIVLRDAAAKASKLASALKASEWKQFVEWEVSVFGELVG